MCGLVSCRLLPSKSAHYSIILSQQVVLYYKECMWANGHGK